MISRRGKEVVAVGYADEAATTKSAIVWLPEGRSKFEQASSLLVANDVSDINSLPRALNLD